MPNYCECDLRIEGTSKQLKKFKLFAKTGKNVLDTNKFVPYPEEFKEQDEKARRFEILTKKINEKIKLTKKEANELAMIHLAYEKDIVNGNMNDGYNSGGYDWCSKNWGTKWGICEAHCDDEIGNCYKGVGDINYSFNCAWAPATPVILAMSKKFRSLKFDLRYFEGGSEFNGMFICKGGKIIEDEQGKYFGMRGG